MSRVRFELTMIQFDQLDPKKAETFVWDFMEPGYDIETFAHWIATDPPAELRIVCQNLEGHDAITSFFDNFGWREVEKDGQEVLYQEGDMIRARGSQIRLRVYISPTVKEKID